MGFYEIIKECRKNYIVFVILYYRPALLCFFIEEWLPISQLECADFFFQSKNSIKLLDLLPSIFLCSQYKPFFQIPFSWVVLYGSSNFLSVSSLGTYLKFTAIINIHTHTHTHNMYVCLNKRTSQSKLTIRLFKTGSMLSISQEREEEESTGELKVLQA